MNSKILFLFFALIFCIKCEASIMIDGAESDALDQPMEEPGSDSLNFLI